MPQGNVDLTFRVKGHKGKGSWYYEKRVNSRPVDSGTVYFTSIRRAKGEPFTIRVSLSHPAPPSQLTCDSNPSPFPNHQGRWADCQYPNHTTHKPTSPVVVVGLRCGLPPVMHFYTNYSLLITRIHSLHYTPISHFKTPLTSLELSSYLS